jgi:hypothetical protein
MSSDKATEARRMRWKLTKRAQRERAKPPVRSVSPERLEALLEERDRRADSAWWARRRVNGVLVPVADRMSWFVADVWLAREVLRETHGENGATPTRIARWLWNEGRQGSYAESSLRPMVYQAFRIIAELESYGRTEGDPPFWTKAITDSA